MPMSIEQVFSQHHDRLMSLPGVVGIGMGEKDGTPAIVVLVARLTPALRAGIPPTLDGHPVVVEESGEIVAF
jgi:hypothetical protein